MQRIDKKIEDSLKKIELIYNIITEKFFGQKKIVEQVLWIGARANDYCVGAHGFYTRANRPESFFSISPCVYFYSSGQSMKIKEVC